MRTKTVSVLEPLKKHYYNDLTFLSERKAHTVLLVGMLMLANQHFHLQYLTKVSTPLTFL